MSVLLMTGASSDIGIELLNRYSDRYHVVWAHYRTMNDRLDQAAATHHNIRLIRTDFTDPADVGNMIGKIEASGEIPDMIVHLPAMKYQLNNFHKCDVKRFESEYRISVLSIVEILGRFIPYMAAKECGRVVFMLSSCTTGDPPAFTGPYTATKYALLGLMRELAVEYAGSSIYINGISPDMVETKFLSGISGLIVQKNAKEQPGGRNLAAADLLPAFEYFLFEGKVTGQNMRIQPI